MGNELFRKKSLDKISSPEDLNRYMRVTTPPMWFAIAVVILLLIGAVIWGIFGQMESKVEAVTVGGSQTQCYVSEESISQIEAGMPVTAGDWTAEITAIDEQPVEAQSVLNAYAMYLGGFQNGEYVYALTLDRELPEGNFSSWIVVEQIHAISLLWD